MARTDSERLAFWLALRDSVEDALAAGAPVVAYEIGNRRVEREPTSSWLRDIEERITAINGLISSTDGPAVNFATRRRPY
jgi:hypothetical protein